MKRRIKYIFVHCTGTRPNVKAESIIRYFKEKGWQQPGYHYLITADGEVIQLTSEDKIANGVYGYNAHAIHVAYIGGLNENKLPQDTRKYSQEMVLEAIVKMLHWKYPEARILGHQEVNRNKSCPCFDVSEWPFVAKQRASVSH